MNVSEEFLTATKTKIHVCDRHFDTNDYATSGTYLRYNAVPSLNLENQEIFPGISSSSMNEYNYDHNVNQEDECNSFVSSSSIVDAEIPLLKKQTQFQNLVLSDDNCNDLDSFENISNSFSSKVSNSEHPLMVEVDNFHSSVAIQTEENDFVVCAQFCLNSAINERFYRKKYLTLKRIVKLRTKGFF